MIKRFKKIKTILTHYRDISPQSSKPCFSRSDAEVLAVKSGSYTLEEAGKQIGTLASWSLHC